MRKNLLKLIFPVVLGLSTLSPKAGGEASIAAGINQNNVTKISRVFFDFSLNQNKPYLYLESGLNENHFGFFGEYKFDADNFSLKPIFNFQSKNYESKLEKGTFDSTIAGIEFNKNFGDFYIKFDCASANDINSSKTTESTTDIDSENGSNYNLTTTVTAVTSADIKAKTTNLGNLLTLEYKNFELSAEGSFIDSDIKGNLSTDITEVVEGNISGVPIYNRNVSTIISPISEKKKMQQSSLSASYYFKHGTLNLGTEKSGLEFVIDTAYKNDYETEDKIEKAKEINRIRKSLGYRDIINQRIWEKKKEGYINSIVLYLDTSNTFSGEYISEKFSAGIKYEKGDFAITGGYKGFNLELSNKNINLNYKTELE
ncbi:MAG: hypothetical protein QW041_02110 [Candidatus Pacearchaeota archaeon]